MKAELTFVAVLICLSTPSFAQWESLGGYDKHEWRNERDLIITSGNSRLHISFLSNDLVRIRLAPDGDFGPDQSWAVVENSWPAPGITIEESPEFIRASSDRLVVLLTKRPLRLSFVDTSGNILNEDEPSKGMSWNGDEVAVWKIMPPDEHYFGFGEKAGRLQRKFTHTTMWNSDIPAYKADTDPLYQTIPFFYGIRQGRSYGIFFDNTYWSTFDMGKTSRSQYMFGAEGGEMNYYFFGGSTPRKILTRFTELVGRMPLPPRWSLGYQQCRWSYPSEQRVREVAKGFRDRQIPCDVIYLDIDYMDGYRIFTWNPKNFPDPAGLIGDLSREGFKIAVIVDPGIKTDSTYHAYRSGLAGDYFLKYPDGQLYVGKVWPGQCAFPDFTSTSAREWWGNQFSVLVEAGVLGWWNDMNEPSVFDVPTKTIELEVLHDDNGLHTSHAKNHNIYGMQMTRATYDGVRKLKPEERPFVLTRSSYAGGHRYSAAWTGDNVATWEHLEMALPMCLNLSISGQPFVGSDIGGFIGSPSGELFARWLQLGVFTPLMRAHSVINEKNKEPWEYGEEFTPINRKTINLRYELLPYIYSSMQEASISGIPPMRPVIFDFPHDEQFLWNDDTFLFGDQLLIAPVLSEGTTERNVYFPDGPWYDYLTGKEFAGGQTALIDAPLDHIPVFAQAGAIIPTRQVVQYSDQAPVDPLTLTFFPPGATGSSSTEYYEDDGRSFDYLKGKYFRQEFTQHRSPQDITMSFSEPEGTYRPPARSIVVTIVGVRQSPSEVTVNERRLPFLQRQGFHTCETGWTYDGDARQILLKFPDTFSARKILIRG